MAKHGPVSFLPLTAYAERGKTAVISPATGQQVRLKNISVGNRSGSGVDAGICAKHASTSYKAWTLIAASTPDATEVTTALQAGTAQTIFTTTNNDGVLVQSRKKFNFIGMNVTQANTGSPVYAASYYNGSSYASLPTISVPTDYATDTQVHAFAAPTDWVVGTTAAVGGDTSLYSVRLVATTHPDTAVKIDALWLATFIAFQEGLADNANLVLNFNELALLELEAGEAIMPYFGAANAANIVQGLYNLV